MSEYTDLLKRLDEAHTEEQEFNRETYGDREFNPEEPTLHSEAAEAIRKLTSHKKPLEITDGMVDVVLEYNRTPRRHLFEYPHRADDSRKYIKDAQDLVRNILRQAQPSAKNKRKV